MKLHEVVAAYGAFAQGLAALVIAAVARGGLRPAQSAGVRPAPLA